MGFDVSEDLNVESLNTDLTGLIIADAYQQPVLSNKLKTYLEELLLIAVVI